MLKSSFILFFFISITCYVIVIIGIVIDYKKRLNDKDLEIEKLSFCVNEYVNKLSIKNQEIKILKQNIEFLNSIHYTNNRRSKNGNKRDF